MNPLIFLDIDGVLITRRSMQHFQSAKIFDPICVEVLNNLIKAINAKVVLSSTWRILYSIEEMRGIFRQQNVFADIIDYTPISHDSPRGIEIAKWLKTNQKPVNYCIIDDDSDMDILMPYLIQTDYNIGITLEDTFKVRELLNG